MLHNSVDYAHIKYIAIQCCIASNIFLPASHYHLHHFLLYVCDITRHEVNALIYSYCYFITECGLVFDSLFPV